MVLSYRKIYCVLIFEICINNYVYFLVLPDAVSISPNYRFQYVTWHRTIWLIVELLCSDKSQGSDVRLRTNQQP